MYAKFLQAWGKCIGVLVGLGFLATPAWAGDPVHVPEPGLTALLAGGLAAAALVARLSRRK